MTRTNRVERRRFELVAAEFLERMGNRMRERRDQLGLSRAEVARRMPGKVNENQIYRWEKGLHQPNSDTLQALANVLDCDVSQFMGPAAVKDRTPDPFIEDSPDPLTEILRLLRRLDGRLSDPQDAAQLDFEAAVLTRLDGIDAAIRELSSRRRRTA